MNIRSHRTKQTISESFLELLKEKSSTRITVTEICAHASINRTTFYKHFLDVQDLQASLENELLSDLETFLQDYCFFNDTKYQTALVEMLTYMRQFGSRFFLLCSENANSELPAKAFQLINGFALPIIQQKIPTVGEEKAKLLYQFLAHGCDALLVNWLRGGSDITVEELAGLIMRISSATVNAAEERGSILC